MADRIGTKAAWLSGLVGVALLAAVIAVALHASEAEAFARLLEQAQPAWLAAALALQAATYLARARSGVASRVLRARRCQSGSRIG
ncbi:MAG: hypothetical protein ACXWCP_22080 [Burkholderiales bacterium]